jgi:Putative peptidoglycan binding domain/CHAP domain
MIKYPGIVKVGQNNPAEAVREIKRNLNRLGYGPLDEKNPSYGASTAMAVHKFQTAYHLASDGEVGELTWKRLREGRVTVVPVAADPRNIGLMAMEIAKSQLYVRELTGKNDGTEVEGYLRAVHLSKGHPWCQAFVYWCFEQAAQRLERNNPVSCTGGVLDCLTRERKEGTTIIYDDPQPGDQGIMDFGHGHGHTFLVTERHLNRVFSIEGNTNNDGSRDGDGVYERNRTIAACKAYIRYA